MDFLPTKGIEYILVLFYLALLVPFWRWISRSGEEPALELESVPHPLRVAGAGSWFKVPDGLFFHRGHSWARPEEEGLVSVGIDDFGYGLIGNPDSILLPEPGRQLQQGERGWGARIDGHVFDFLSPVDGEVVEVNEAAAHQPMLASADPYEGGWLLKLKPKKSAHASLANLLPTDLARAWMDDVQAALGRRMGMPEMAVLQDGGLPVSGFARQIGGDHWHELAQEFLLTKEPD